MTPILQTDSPWRHWHPVLLSKALRRSPVEVTLLGKKLVVFRTSEGVGALGAICPHRGMALVKGKVTAGRLVCPYHGWSFDDQGRGRCPASPKREVETSSYAAIDRDGAVWVTMNGKEADFPALSHPDYQRFAELEHNIAAPLALCLDNVIEIEHTGMIHLTLGYDASDIGLIEHRVETTSDSISIHNTGPQRKAPAPLRWSMGVSKGDWFTDDMHVEFSPVRVNYDQYWLCPKRKTRRPLSLRVTIVFTPIDEHRTMMFTFANVAILGFRAWLWPVFRPLLAWLTNYELTLDQRVVEMLGDKDPSMRGRRLGKFDRPLVAARQRIATNYLGLSRDAARSLL
jgi:phenylpropionate dioxygenase-like ring-hydroxylating dioxygenase large terminal subunit